jgi:hypothetical protein
MFARATIGKRYLLFLAALCLGGCGSFSGLVLIGSAQAPGTDGYVEVDEAGSGTRVRVHMERLPAPEQLGEGLKCYVVWFKGQGGKPIRAGALAYKPEARTGDLVRTCPLKEFQITVTAERSPEVTAPGELIVTGRAVSADQ